MQYNNKEFYVTYDKSLLQIQKLYMLKDVAQVKKPTQ